MKYIRWPTVQRPCDFTALAFSLRAWLPTSIKPASATQKLQFEAAESDSVLALNVFNFPTFCAIACDFPDGMTVLEVNQFVGQLRAGQKRRALPSEKTKDELSAYKNTIDTRVDVDACDEARCKMLTIVECAIKEACNTIPEDNMAISPDAIIKDGFEPSECYRSATEAMVYLISLGGIYRNTQRPEFKSTPARSPLDPKPRPTKLFPEPENDMTEIDAKIEECKRLLEQKGKRKLDNKLKKAQKKKEKELAKMQALLLQASSSDEDSSSSEEPDYNPSQHKKMRHHRARTDKTEAETAHTREYERERDLLRSQRPSLLNLGKDPKISEWQQGLDGEDKYASDDDVEDISTESMLDGTVVTSIIPGLENSGASKLFHSGLLYGWQMLGIGLTVNSNAPLASLSMLANVTLKQAKISKENMKSIVDSILFREGFKLNSDNAYGKLGASVARDTFLALSKVTKLIAAGGSGTATKTVSANVSDKYETDEVLKALRSAVPSMRISAPLCTKLSAMSNMARPDKHFLIMARAKSGDQKSINLVNSSIQMEDTDKNVRAAAVHFMKQTTAHQYEGLDKVKSYSTARMKNCANILKTRGIDPTDSLMLEFTHFRYGMSPLNSLFDVNTRKSLKIGEDSDLSLTQVVQAIKIHRSISRAMGNHIWQPVEEYDVFTAEIETLMTFAEMANCSFGIKSATVLNTAKTSILKLWNKEWLELTAQFQTTDAILGKHFPSLKVASGVRGHTHHSRFRDDWDFIAHPKTGTFYMKVKRKQFKIEDSDDPDSFVFDARGALDEARDKKKKKRKQVLPELSDSSSAEEQEAEVNDHMPKTSDGGKIITWKILEQWWSVYHGKDCWFQVRHWKRKGCNRSNCKYNHIPPGTDTLSAKFAEAITGCGKSLDAGWKIKNDPKSPAKKAKTGGKGKSPKGKGKKKKK